MLIANVYLFDWRFISYNHIYCWMLNMCVIIKWMYVCVMYVNNNLETVSYWFLDSFIFSYMVANQKVHGILSNRMNEIPFQWYGWYFNCNIASNNVQRENTIKITMKLKRNVPTFIGCVVIFVLQSKEENPSKYNLLTKSMKMDRHANLLKSMYSSILSFWWNFHHQHIRIENSFSFLFSYLF